MTNVVCSVWRIRVPEQIGQNSSLPINFAKYNKLLITDESYGDNVDSKEQEVFVTKDEVAQAFSHFSYECVYGRTDKGEKGMHHFLRTHEYSALCHLLI